MKDSEILRRAKLRIEQKSNTYICYAINDAIGGTVKQANSLTDWVQKMLGPHLFYEGWLAKNHRDLYLNHRHDFAWMREARLAWLDWMIAYCEKEEAGQPIILKPRNNNHQPINQG